jgi:dihydrofolate synthase/folylpolyglutamate synthase
LLATLDESFPARHRTVIFSCSRDKDHRAMLSLLLAGCDRLILTRFANSPRSLELEPLAATARELAVEKRRDGTAAKAEVDAVDSSAAAWRMAVEDALPEDLICITGSFFLAAEMRPFVVGQASSLSESGARCAAG